MKMVVLIDVKLSEKEQIVAAENIKDFCSEHISLKGIDSSDYKVINADNIDNIKIEQCGFREEIVNAFHYNDINFLVDLEKYRYLQILEIVRERKAYKSFRLDDRDMEKIERMMAKYDLTFAEYDLDKYTKIEDCNFSGLLKSRLLFDGIKYLEDVTVHTRKYISKIPNLGEKCLSELDEKLKEFGLWYRED